MKHSMPVRNEVFNSLVQGVVEPSFEDVFNSLHADRADIRVRCILELLLQSLQSGDGITSVFGVDLLKLTPDQHAHCCEALQIILVHGCPSGFGEKVEAIVGEAEQSSVPFIEMERVMDERLNYSITAMRLS